MTHSLNVIERSGADRFRILVCIDGSDDAYRGLRYAAKLGHGVDSDITLLYVRPIDQGLNSGGLQVRVARDNMLDWGLDLPGMRWLKKGYEILMEMGEMSSDWETSQTTRESHGDPAGENTLSFRHESGKVIHLRLKVAYSIEGGILDEQEEGQYNLIILGASGPRGTMEKVLGPTPVAMKVAIHAKCSVILARGLEEGHGHLICTNGSPRSLDMVRNDAVLASRCNCPVSLLSVCPDEAGRSEAQAGLNLAIEALTELGIEPREVITRVGDPAYEIVAQSEGYSLVVMSATATGALKRFFVGGVAVSVLQHSKGSVMVVR
ncbi:UspA domain protein [Magnetococcus marinus MC-1]|uniref:UspA domain protein n=1 Tax=Magnetococcus marinus (strain ATCC BAA-1437 / JCM 17883 / MC-1) TaxID=156889 RepID=A0L8B4_MAGMM|nr:universal stress protein [Magnetococcus marinus]ABK44207.1 UspA domain protein [Magnetococcus marinus MC-1]